MLSSTLLVAAVVLTPSNTDIVVPEGTQNAQAAVQFAAEEMKGFLSRAFGADIPIVHAVDPSRVSIILGTNGWSAAAGVDVADLPQDAARIRTAPNRVYIAGRDAPGFSARMSGTSLLREHGTLNGVYGFLERHFGCRFYFPGELGEIVPRTAQVRIPDLDFVDRPDYTIRTSTSALGTMPEVIEKAPSAKTLFFLRLRSSTRNIPCCHGQSRSGFAKRFGKTHPEYFLVKENGERKIGDPVRQKNPDSFRNSAVCNSSGIWNEIFEDAKSYLSGEGPEVRGMVVGRGEDGFKWGSQARHLQYYDIMPGDGMHKCFCERCQAEYAKAKNPADYADEFIWGKVAEVGRRLKDAGVKGTVTMMAYHPYQGVPEVDLPDNVAVMVCNNGPWLSTPETHDRAIANVRAWTEKCRGKVWLWHNTGRYNNFAKTSVDIPSPTPRAFGRHYREVAPLVFGAYCSNNSQRFLYSAINYYVFYRVAWTNATDVDALLDEYVRLMFGRAAGPMARFLDLLEEKWMKEVIANVEDTPIGTMVVSPSEFRLWAKIYPLAFVNRLAALVAEAERAVAPDSIEGRRVRLFKEEMLEPMFAHARAFGNGAVAEEKARRSAHPRPSVVRGFKPTTITVTPDMTNRISHVATFAAPLEPGHSYRISYFVRCTDVRPYHHWCGVGACVWYNSAQDRTLALLGSGLSGTFDWICQKKEFTVPADACPPDFKPRVDLRVNRAVGTAEFDGLLVEDITDEKPVSAKPKSASRKASPKRQGR